MYVYMYVYMYVCMHVCIYVCMHACMYVSMYICMYVSMYYVCIMYKLRVVFPSSFAREFIVMQVLHYVPDEPWVISGITNCKHTYCKDKVLHSGATVEVVLTSNTTQGIFQTKEMQLAFSDFPEILMVDATFQLNDIKMSLCVVNVQYQAACPVFMHIFLRFISLRY